MSWQPPASAAPERGPYAPPPQPPLAQPYGNQQNMYPNYQGAPPAGNAQQQYWQTQQQPQYNQQYGQVYQQQDYGTNANQFYQQQTQYNQNYSTQGYANSQQGLQQTYYPPHGVQAGYQGKPNSDNWEDNWDWGWEDTSKQAQNATAQNPLPVQAAPQPQLQAFNNANVIEESFASTDTWDWSNRDKKDTKEPAQVPKQEPAQLPVENASLGNNTETNNKPHSQNSANNIPIDAPTEEVRSLNDRDVVKERLPNLALGKRFHLDNLTPQWSIESQMSQESSDGPLTHSEGTYRSENQSRNSSKSSPGLNTDNSNFNYSQSALDEYPPSSEWSRHTNLEPTIVDNEQSNSRRESHNDLTNSLQEMSIANKENPAPDASKVSKDPESRNMQDNVPVNALQSSVSQPNFPPPVSSVLVSPLSAISASMPPAPPVTTSALPPPPTSSAMMPPPTSFPPSSSNTNPFKQSAPFSHKKVPSASPTLQSFPPSTSSTNLTSPAAVSKVSQHRMPVGFGANLETTPDNSERPDQPQMSAFRPMPVAQQVPDNLEVAPQNDRNEYLQTAHLSSGDYGENTDFSRGAPPPGLRRMVVGQQETEYSQSLNISGDEPPPGLARMVPGQQNEVANSYNQPNDNYMDRHIDGQTTEGAGRPYRQADGQQTPDNYSQPPANRGQERRPIGLDRMVPGEPSNDEYSQYQGPNYGSANEQRVVMGVDHDYPIPTDAGPSDIREQNVDGSDYSEQTPRNAPRNVIGAQQREVNNDSTADFNLYEQHVQEQQREIVMDGENLQDLSVISSGDLTYSREQTLDGADITLTDLAADRKTDLSDSIDHPVTSSRRQSAARLNSSGEESDRERSYKSSPRKDKDKHKPSRDREKDRERDKEGRYSRGDRKYERESDRRSVRDDKRPDKDRRDRDRDRRDRDLSPESRRHRRSTRSHRYDTEDTEYYSDRERERRRYREGSYASKPPRPDKDRRHEERERSRRYNTVDRDRRYDDRRERHETRYRDIDPRRKHGNLHKEREDEERRRVTFSSDAKPNASEKQGSLGSSPSRGSGGGTNTDDDGEARRRTRRSRPPRDRADPYYDGYGGGVYGDPYALQVQQYQYYEHLRRTDPAAYMQVYQQLMAGSARTHHHNKHPYAEGYTSLGYEARGEGGSVHSGRSSTTGLKGNDTYYVSGASGRLDGSLRDAPSLRTDLSDRELNTDASLNLQLEESTVRSERMTPFKFSTAHCKGSISSRHVVVVRGAYPVDGRPPTVHLLSLQAASANDPGAAELAKYPGPLVKGVTHKKSVMQYCLARVREAGEVGRDRVGYGLLWELLALLLRQNGVVVGADIAELLMKNAREERLEGSHHSGSRAGSSVEGESRAWSPLQPSPSVSDTTPQEDPPVPPGGDQAAVDRLREHLIYGNRQEALEWAMSQGLWGHALALASLGERRVRALVASRFLAHLPRQDSLHTLYAHLHCQLPPAATHAAEERWADWRPHAAMMLANASSRPDHDTRALTQLGDSLAARGLLYSAQFCYVSCGLPVERHPLAPLQPPQGGKATTTPRLSLLLADPRASTLPQLATNQAIFATEIYEYALSLNRDYVINELQVYKLMLACRLVDCGQYERALAYVEQAARCVTKAPHEYSPGLLHQLAGLAERLKYHDPALSEPPLEEGAEEEPSPRHQQWLLDVQRAAQLCETGADSLPASQHETPQHQYAQQQQQQQQYSWSDQPQQQYQQQYPEPEDNPDYSQYYQQPPVPPQQPDPQPAAEQYGGYEDWGRTEEQHSQAYADPYWQPDTSYGYPEAGAGSGEGGGAGDEPRPTITMPGARPQPPPYGEQDDGRPPSADQADDTDTPKSAPKKEKKEEGGADGRGKGGGWLGGILTKLSLRPPNQMILPDDKNPSIVWDPDKKRWRNVDGEEEESRAAPPPPHAPPAHATPMQNSSPLGAAPPVSNIFKMQKGRHIKKSYVDVFNPSGAATRPLPPPAEVLGPAPLSGPAPAYFVPLAPAPAHQQPVTLSMPESWSASPADSPQPSPLPSPCESGVYDPTQAELADDYRSGI